jgi:hypothetical protein
MKLEEEMSERKRIDDKAKKSRQTERRKGKLIAN